MIETARAARPKGSETLSRNRPPAAGRGRRPRTDHKQTTKRCSGRHRSAQQRATRKRHDQHLCRPTRVFAAHGPAFGTLRPGVQIPPPRPGQTVCDRKGRTPDPRAGRGISRNRIVRGRSSRGERKYAREAVSGVFISYRREDTAYIAGRLHDELAARFGDQQIFRDVDSMRPGTDFVTMIQDSVASSDALIVMIGDAWLGPRTPREGGSTTRRIGFTSRSRRL
jgi:hypothetical protein